MKIPIIAISYEWLKFVRKLPNSSVQISLCSVVMNVGVMTSQQSLTLRHVSNAANTIKQMNTCVHWNDCKMLSILHILVNKFETGNELMTFNELKFAQVKLVY